MATGANRGSTVLHLPNDLSLQIKISIIAVSTLAILFQDIHVIGSNAPSSDYYVLLIPPLTINLKSCKETYARFDSQSGS